MQDSKEKMDREKKPHPEGTKSVEPAATGVVETVKDKMRAMATDVSDLVTKTKDTAQEWASSAADAAVDAKDKAVEMASMASHKVGDVGHASNVLMRRYPIQTVLIGIGVGFFLGQIIHRAAPERS